MLGKGLFRWITYLALAATLGLAAACSPAAGEVKTGGEATVQGEVKVSSDANGQKVTIKQGQVLSIRLESNPSTGYSWEIAERDAAILALQGEAVYEQANPGQNLVGGGGWQTFRFLPGKTGQTKLRLVYRRSWENNVAPLKVFEIQVTIE